MGKGGLGNMMKQIQQMQAKMEEAQKELEEAEVEGSSGGGMVKVTVSGKHEIRALTIDPEVVDKEDVEMLADLVMAAVNQANQRVQELQTEQMSGLTGGMNIPGLNLPM